MFSLVVSIIGILLVVALALAALYYGGTAYTAAGTKASAAALINQATQIEAAATVSDSQTGAWPATLSSIAPVQLATMPVPPQNAYAAGKSSADHWDYYLPGQTHHISLANKIRDDVCQAVNRSQGFIGIPVVWDGVSHIQCFGPGVAAGSGALAYTFLYTPNGTTADQNLMVLAKGLNDANVAIATAPIQVVAVDGSTATPTPVSTATPGYPVLCPSGSYINTGSCIDNMAKVTSSQTGGPVAPPSGGYPEPTDSSAYGCYNYSPIVDKDGWTQGPDSDKSVFLIIYGPNAGANFGSVATQNVSTDFTTVTARGDNAYDQAYVTLTLEGHAPAVNVPIKITGADGSTVVCYENVVAAYNEDDNMTDYNLSIEGSSFDLAGGYPMVIKSDVDTFVVGPNGEKPVVYFGDKIVAPSNLTVVDATTLRINAIPSFVSSGGWSNTFKGDVTVQNYNQYFSRNAYFDWNATPVPMTITAVGPNEGYFSGGTLVTLTGTNFLGNETVTMNGRNAPVLAITPTEIKISTPAATFDEIGPTSIIVSHPALYGDPSGGTVSPPSYWFDYIDIERAFSASYPNEVQSGGLLYVNGPHVTADSQVFLGSQLASVNNFSYLDNGWGLLAVNVPPGTGTVTITVKSGNLTDSFVDAITYY